MFVISFDFFFFESFLGLWMGIEGFRLVVGFLLFVLFCLVKRMSKLIGGLLIERLGGDIRKVGGRFIL